MSIKRNFIYNSFITVSGYISPLLTYPYVSRVLGVTNIGACNFVDSFINYFVLVSMMGISAIGIREIAGCRGDRKKLSRTFSNVLILNAISTVVAMIVLLAAIYYVPSLSDYRNLLYVGVCKLVFNLFLVEWFYTGMEDFRYITKRTITVRLLYVVSIFVFIHDESDYHWYYILTVASVCLNAVINIWHSRKYVDFSFNGVNLKKYLNTFFTVGVYLLITNVYTSLNAAWLGFATDDEQVGYYTTAIKLYTILMALFTAFCNVMFPCVSHLLAEKKIEEYWIKIGIAVEALFAFAFPAIIFTSIFSSNILHLLSGDGYEGAYVPFRIISVLILVIGYEKIVVLQILLANKNEKTLLYNSIIGAIIAIICNMLLLQRYGAIGSAIVWLMSETTILLLSLYYAKTKYNYCFPYKSFMKYVISYTPLIAILLMVFVYVVASDVLLITLAATITLLYTVLVQSCYIKNEIVLQLKDRLNNYVDKIKKI